MSDALPPTQQYTWDLAGSCIYRERVQRYSAAQQMKTGLLFLSTAFLLSNCNGNLRDTNSKSGVCEGSVTLYEGSEETVVTEYMNVKVTVDKVVLEGCPVGRMGEGRATS